MQNTTSPTGRQDARLSEGCPELAPPLKLLGNHKLLQTFPIRLPDGRQWVGTLWATPTRSSGRRIQVRDANGVGLFDTNDCYDQGNAVNALEHWLRVQIGQTQSNDRDTELLCGRSTVARSLKRA